MDYVVELIYDIIATAIGSFVAAFLLQISCKVTIKAKPKYFYAYKISLISLISVVFIGFICELAINFINIKSGAVNLVGIIASILLMLFIYGSKIKDKNGASIGKKIAALILFVQLIASLVVSIPIRYLVNVLTT